MEIKTPAKRCVVKKWGQWLNEALCFVSIPIVIGSGGRKFSASKSPTSLAAKVSRNFNKQIV
jgi:hypothetical protein